MKFLTLILTYDVKKTYIIYNSYNYVYHNNLSIMILTLYFIIIINIRENAYLI